MLAVDIYLLGSGLVWQGKVGYDGQCPGWAVIVACSTGQLVGEQDANKWLAIQFPRLAINTLN